MGRRRILLLLIVAAPCMTSPPTPRMRQLVERFNDTALVIVGTGWGKGTLKSASGPFFGEILIFEALRAPFNTIRTRCRTDRFELVRR